MEAQRSLAVVKAPVDNYLMIQVLNLDLFSFLLTCFFSNGDNDNHYSVLALCAFHTLNAFNFHSPHKCMGMVLLSPFDIRGS